MAKKQTRRSISVSRMTYERLKAFCEANNISMSQLVETRVNDFLGEGGAPSPTVTITPSAPRPMAPAPSAARPMPTAPQAPVAPKQETAAPVRPVAQHPAQAVPMTSAAARFAVDPPPPIIKPKQETNAPKPAEKKADQIFTF